MANEEPREVERVKLTNARVRDMKPRPDRKDRFVWDEELPGFCVRIRPSGFKAYWIRFRNEKQKQCWVSVGEYPKVTSEQARKVAKERLGAVSQGGDPAKTREARKAALTVKEAHDRFIEEHVDVRLKPSTAKEYKRQFALLILPVIEKMSINDVTYEHIAKIHLGLKDRPILSNRVHALLSKFFNACEQWRLRPHGSNPCLGHPKFREQSRERFLSDSEMEKLGKVLDEAAEDGTEDFQAIQAIQMLMFTGMRLNEVLTLRWQDVDETAGLLRLDDTKGGKATIDINPLMKVVLDRMKEWARVKKKLNAFVFPGRTKVGHFVGLRRIWIRLLKRAEIMGEKDTVVPVRLHDVRRTYGTVGASDVGLTHETIGKILRHKQTSTTQIYARLASSARKDANVKIADAMARKLGTNKGA